MTPEHLSDVEILRLDAAIAQERRQRAQTFTRIANERRMRAARRTEMAVS